MLDRANSDPTFMERIITGNETWDYEWDMQSCQQSLEWRTKDEPKPKKPRQSRLKVKVMLILFFDFRSLVSDLWKNNSSILYDDNAPSYRATVMTEFKAKNTTNTIN